MLYFIPWVVLIVAVVVAVPVAAKMSPSPGYAGGGNVDEAADEYSEGDEEEVAVADDLVTDEDAEPLADDAFEEFN